ncbi:DUF192 domain-containing protein [Candidatus Omnitrophota bacterium]
MRIVLRLVFIFLVFIIAGPIWSYPEQACFKDSCFELELANTPEQRDQGLMFRRELGDNKGMLFVFEGESTHCFWMKNTLIPLDIIWLNKDREVVYILRDAQPCKSSSCPKMCPEEKAMYVLEVNAGVCDGLGLRSGDTLSWANDSDRKNTPE